MGISMGVKTTYLTKKFILPCAVWMLTFFGWAEFFAKPFILRGQAKDIGWSGALADLLKPIPEAFGWPLAGYFFILISALVIFVSIVFLLRPIRYALTYLETAESPISVIHSEYELTFNDDHSSVRCKRTQYLHANRPNVNAYHYKMSPYEGTIEVKEIKSQLDGNRITKDLIDNSKGKSKEFIEEFEGELPLSFFITYFPDKWVYWSHINWGWFKKTLVKRTVETIDVDEYNIGRPAFEVEARYPVSGLTITLKFPESHGPADGDIRAYFADDGALRNIIPQSDSDDSSNRVHTVDFGQLQAGQKLRIEWPILGN